MEKKNNNNKKIKDSFKVSEVISIIFITLVIGIIVGYAVTINFNSDKLNNNDEALEEFVDTYNDIKENYYEDVDTNDLINGAISGMLSVLEDPYTTYLDESVTSDFNDRLTGSYSGIGVEVNMDKDDNVYVVTVFDDSPAARAGLQVGDIFKKIDNTDVSSYSSAQISDMIKNSKNKNMNITILRGDKTLTLNLKLETIELDSITFKVVEHNSKKIGYIDVDLFALNTYSQFSDALTDLEKQGINSLVIDVRNNSGGYLDTVTNIISLFLKEHDVIYQLDEKGDITKVFDETKESRDYKVVVLTNEYSASASEILASSMQESYGAIVVGTNSYGKGTVQQTKDLNETGGMLKYTVQKWLTPKGNWINDKGVTPDIKIELNEKYYETFNEEDDNQYWQAIEEASK